MNIGMGKERPKYTIFLSANQFCKKCWLTKLIYIQERWECRHIICFMSIQFKSTSKTKENAIGTLAFCLLPVQYNQD